MRPPRMFPATMPTPYSATTMGRTLEGKPVTSVMVGEM